MESPFLVRCPVCKRSTGYFEWEGTEPGTIEMHPFPLYQRSYLGKPGHITERCYDCYEKAEAKSQWK